MSTECVEIEMGSGSVQVREEEAQSSQAVN